MHHGLHHIYQTVVPCAYTENHSMPPTPTTNPDAELLLQCTAFARVEVTRQRWNAGLAPRYDDEKHSEALMHLWWRLARRIMPIRPTTWAGFRAKAVALRDFVDGTSHCDGPDLGEFATALATDLVAFGEEMPA